MKNRDHAWLANLSFYSGAILCVVAVLTKFQGGLVGGHQPISVFIAGVGLMVFFCALKLRSKE